MNYLFYLCIILLFTLFFLTRKILLLNNKKKDLEKKLNQSMIETLELSTSDQLLKELRSRKNMPFILIFPIKEDYYNGLSVEFHCLNDVSSLALLHLARSISIQNLKKNGVEIPKFPPLRDYFE